MVMAFISAAGKKGKKEKWASLSAMKSAESVHFHNIKMRLKNTKIYQIHNCKEKKIFKVSNPSQYLL